MDFPPVRISRKRLQNLYQGFLKELRKKRPETRGTYERAFREFLRWFPVDRRFVFRVKDVERYKSYLAHRKKLAPVSVSTYLTALRQFCDYLVGASVLRDNPADHVKGNKRPMTHSRETITAEQIDTLLRAIERVDERGFRDYAVVRAMLDCGLSEIELVRADIGDLRVVSSRTVLSVQGKGRARKDTGVILPPDVKDAFDSYLAFRRDADPAEPLLMSTGNRTRGERMTTRGIRERVNHYLEKAGIKHGRSRRITPFSLRHSAAVRYAELGASVEELQSRFRIATANTAMIYLRQGQEKTEEGTASHRPDTNQNTGEE